VTGGNVRRSFENLLQIDASFYGGDSGGPIIDTRGKVIGIASGVATERAHGLMPVATPLWSMAMVLPITKVAIFLEEVKVGKAKWNGVLDLSVDAKLKRILETATQGRWAEAMTMADKELMLSADPSLVMAAGMMHFCAEDNPGAHRLFDQSLSMDTDNNLARFMLCIIDWLKGLPSADANRHKLITLDWRSPAEFFGYLFRVLEGSVDEKSALKGWDTEAEKSWLHYVVGHLRAKSGEWAEAEQLLRTAVLAAESDAWEFFLARAMLDQVQKKKLATLQGNARWEQYQADIESFNQTVQSDQANKESRRVKLAALNNRLKDPSAGPKDKRHMLENIYQSTPENGDVLVGLAFYSAMEEAWQQALEYARIFLKREGRQSAGRLSVGLLEAELLRLLDQQDDALEKLKAYVRVMRDPWYRAVAESLLGKRSDESLKQEAGTNPETFLVLSTAWGLWAEGSGDKEKAIEYYKEALESLVDDRLEFEFSKERIKSLRRHMAE
jgi:tetratricopeptide (TPR) repeat protein